MKTCPFCGSDDVGPAYGIHTFGHEIINISCSCCGAAGPVSVYPPPEHSDQAEFAEQHAEREWNKRQIPRISPRCVAQRVMGAAIYVIYGAQGVGKQHIAEALAAQFGFRLVDEWHNKPLQPGDVAVTNTVPPPVVPGAMYIEVKRPHDQAPSS
jgi:Lar family restriction alleviation protein